MMETLNQDGQKVTENIYFYDFGEDESGIPIIYHTNRKFYEDQSRLMQVDTTRLEALLHDEPQGNRWMKGMINGMAVTALMWCALWLLGKLVFG